MSKTYWKPLALKVKQNNETLEELTFSSALHSFAVP